MSKSKAEVKGTRRMVLLSLLLAIGVGLHALEAAIPVPIALPGAKLGLANIVTLISLYALGPVEAIALAASRVLLGGLVTGTFGSTSFIMAMAGALGSGIAMSIFRGLTAGKGRFAAVCSILGAIFHNLSQLWAFSLISDTSKVFVMLPYLLAVALPAGYFTGLGGIYALSAIKSIPGFRQRLEEISAASGKRSLIKTAAVMVVLIALGFGAVELSERMALARVTEDSLLLIDIERFDDSSKRGRTVMTIPWPHQVSREEGQFNVEGRLGTSLLEYDSKLGVRFITSPCPDKLCVAHGWVNDEMDLAACLPNGLIVTVKENR